jgi:hypothetical protein
VVLNHLLQEEGRGGQTRLATAKDIDRDYLNAICQESTGRIGRNSGQGLPIISHNGMR